MDNNQNENGRKSTFVDYSKMNPFYASGVAQANFEANIHYLQPDYNVVSTFAGDFAIADVYGLDAIRDTFNRSFNNYKEDIYMMTEMCLVLNWAIWRYFELNQLGISKLYNELWQKCDAWCMEHFTGDELQFFLSVTD